MTPEQAVQHQLDAYNARNLERFVSVYDENVKVYRPPAGEPTMVGRQALSDFHRLQRFHLAGLRAELLNRIVAGNKVVDHERVSGVAEKPFEVAVVYEVNNGLISSVWFFPA
jgi:hypothetical protein